MIRKTILVVMSVLVLRGIARGDDSNAALQYWQAFAQLPSLNPAQQKIMGDVLKTPLNAESRRIVESGEAALRQLHRGSALPHCDWGLHKEDGFLLLLPHLGRSRELARLALLRARFEFSDHNIPAALDDVLDTMVLARQGGADDIMIGLLVQDAIEQQAIEVLETHLGQLDAGALRQLQSRLKALPAGGTIKGIVAGERDFGDKWLIRKFQAAAQNPEQDRFVSSLGQLDQSLPAAYAAAGATPQAAIKELEGLLPFYTDLEELLQLPPAEFRLHQAGLLKKYEKNSFARCLLPAYNRFYDRHLQARTRMVLLEAAVAIRLSSPEDQLEKFADPAGDGPFGIVVRSDGFELQSKLTDRDGKPISFSVQTARP